MMKKILFLCAFCLLFSGCCAQRFDLNGQRPTIPTYEGTSHFVFWGIGQTKEIDPNEVCGSRGISSVETHTSFLNGFLSAITWGIYKPETYVVYCNKAK